LLILVCWSLAVPRGTVKMTLTPIFVDLCLIFLAVNVVSGISRRKMLTIIQNAAIPAMILSCNIILTLTNYMMDGLLCMLWIKPFRERIVMLVYRIVS
jgi:hypothetical protein